MSSPWLDRFALFIATFAHSGNLRPAPGTIASALTILIWSPYVLTGSNVSWVLFLSLVLTGLGLWATHRALRFFDSSDPKSIVIDEVAGQSLALLFAGPSVVSLLCAFALFRLFDILKPWPVCAFERLSGTWGVMLDDIAAGLMAALGVLLLQHWAVWL